MSFPTLSFLTDVGEILAFSFLNFSASHTFISLKFSGPNKKKRYLIFLTELRGNVTLNVDC